MWDVKRVNGMGEGGKERREGGRVGVGGMNE